MNAATAIEAPKEVMSEALELVRATPMQRDARADIVRGETGLERKMYWRKATVGVVRILASLRIH